MESNMNRLEYYLKTNIEHKNKKLKDNLGEKQKIQEKVGIIEWRKRKIIKEVGEKLIFTWRVE